MNEFTTTAAVLFGILLRFGIPIAITFGLSYLLRRLDEHWRAEAEEEAARAKYKTQQATLLQLWIQQPCWEIKNCSKNIRDQCLAYQEKETPCWETFRTNGNLSARCQKCEYQQTLKESIIINN